MRATSTGWATSRRVPVLLLALGLAFAVSAPGCGTKTIIKKKDASGFQLGGQDPNGLEEDTGEQGGEGGTPGEGQTDEDAGTTPPQDTGEGGTGGDDAAQTGEDGAPAAIDTGAPAADAGGSTKDAAPPKDAGPKDLGSEGDDAGTPQEPDADEPDTAPQEPDTGSVPPDVPKWDGGEKPPTCVDLDADGFGKGCPAGADCDDKNPNFHEKCPNCFAGAFPGCPCTGTEVSCYNGDWTLIGKGVCEAGKQVCVDKFWSKCIGEMLPQAEICDYKDNDCDGQTDEGAQLSVCGNCDMSCTIETKGPDFNNAFDPNKQNSSGVGTNDKGYLILDATKVNLKFIWIANSGEGTVSKLDTQTGWELGRYKVCSDPSRTSVDLIGDAWVGCRGDGGVAKILIAKELCVDKNNDGVINTSEDKDGNHVISGGEMLPKGADECVKFVVYPAGATIARAMGVDKENHVWVGFWSASKIVRLHEADGSKLDEINIGTSPYGLVVDNGGIIWAQGGFSALTRIDPVTKQVSKFPYPAGAYGIGLDYQNRPWVASGGSASRFDPKTNQWSVVNIASGGRGIAGSSDGFVYAAGDGSHKVTKINSDTMQNVGTMDTGGSSPVGVAVDSDGFVWAVNQGSSNAAKMDPKTMQNLGVHPVGSSPYTYSDMTGYTANTFTAPQGHYQTTFGVDAYRSIWQSIDVDAIIPEGSSVKLRFKVAATKEALQTATWFGPYGPFPPEKFPYDVSGIDGLNGDYMLVEVTLISKDKKSTPVVKAIKVQYKALPK